MGRVAKEEARTRALTSNHNTRSAPRWRGRDEAITVGVEVVNPLKVPLTLTEASFFGEGQGKGGGAPAHRGLFCFCFVFGFGRVGGGR
jgi:hypothetical protein